MTENNSGADATARILVVDDHPQARESMSDVLRQAGYSVHCCASAKAAVKLLEEDSFDLVITDLRMPGMSGLELIRHVQEHGVGVQVVMVTAHASVASAVEAMRHGAFDYIEKPFRADQLEQLAQRAIEHGHRLDCERKLSCAASETAPCMVGSSEKMRLLKERVACVAGTSETVLIMGETGTGKELVARSVHAQSRRAAAPLVSLNCPVLSEHLLESELFGHRRGAFTGADADRTGRFQLADGGTLLLDEITEIDLPLQAKLLRVLQEKTFEPVGSSETISVDVRVLATTNRDLREEVQAGGFREDLYYRLNVLPILVPPLRERREDVPALIDHFLERAAQRLGTSLCRLTRDTQQLLAEYHWPGNVRELENIVTRASVLGGGEAVSADQVRPWLIGEGREDQPAQAEVPVGLSLQEMERKMIEATLERFGGHRSKTAEALGIGLRTLTGKLRSYGYAPREKCFAKAG